MDAAIDGPVSHAALDVCAHCGSPLASGAGDAYCCAGCRAVAHLIASAGLGRYYALRRGPASPVDLSGAHDRQWLEPIAEELRRATGPASIELDAQGLHCTGCVWLIEELLTRAGGIEVVVNPALGRLSLRVEPAFDLAAFVDEVERFGYRLGPPLKGPSAARDALLVRTAVAIGLAANAMMFGLAIYLGLDSGPIFDLMRALELALAMAAVAVALPVFARGAVEGLRRGMLHLDLPIALGMVLALAGTIAAYAIGADAAYADTVAVFVALMLLGRWLQARAIAQNRDRLLASQGAAGLAARRIESGILASVRAGDVREGDRLLIAPTEIAVVDARLEDGALVALDWISGESAPRTLRAGDRIPAGAINAGRSAIRARAETAFDRSPLDALLGKRMPERDERAPSRFWDRVSRVYVIGVLAAASVSFAAWMLATGDLLRALEVATAVLVVTCPCGIGIATPLAYELAATALRRRGLFVRRERALDRAAEVRRCVFDKTGTLTTGRVELVDPSVLDTLAAADRGALFDLAARSVHPKSEAVRRAFGACALREDVDVVEEPGRGLSATIDGTEYTLGSGEGADLVFARDGRMLAALSTREVLRPDAADEIDALEKEGVEVAILSGDERGRVDAIAERAGVPRERAVAACTPDDKARWLAAHRDRTTLFVGDGINDGPAADAADLAGTPAIDRPHAPARADFFYVTAGLAPIRALLHAGHTIRRVARRNLVIAALYNTIAIALAASGHMAPWLAAILMPLSSLAVVGSTVLSLEPARWRSTPWKS